MKFCLSLLACVAISFYSFSQTIPQNPNVTDAKGLRQGKWTLLYDASWNPVTDYSKAVYYRLLTYKSDKPVGIVRDYFSSGKVQWEGRLLADRPQEISDGEAVWYREDGSREMTKNFDKGKLLREQFYNLDGSISQVPWSVLSFKANEANNAGQFDNALDLFKKAIEQAEKQFGKNHVNYAYSINDLAIFHSRRGNFDESSRLSMEALSIQERILGTDHPEYSIYVHNLGSLYDYQGNYTEAERYYRKAISNRERVVGRDNQAYIIFLQNLAYLYSVTARFEKSDSTYSEIRVLTEKVFGEQSIEFSNALNQTGYMFQSQGNYAKAEEFYIRGRDIRLKVSGERSSVYASSLRSLADLYKLQGDYAKSEAQLLEATEIIKEVSGSQSNDFALMINSLALLYWSAGNYEKAEDYYHQALAITNNNLGKNTREYVAMLNNLGLVYNEQSKYKEAEKLFKSALLLFPTTYGTNHYTYGKCLNNLALSLEGSGRYTEADSLYYPALKIIENNLGKNHVEYANVLHNLAYNEFRRGKYTEAELHFREAISIQQDIFGKDHAQYLAMIQSLAYLHYAQRKYESAISLFAEITEGRKKQIKAHFPVMSENEKRSFYSTIWGDFQVFNSVSIERYAQNPELAVRMFNNQLVTKGVLVSANVKIREAIFKSGDDSLIHNFSEWQRERNELIKAYRMSIQERKKANVVIEAIEDRINTLEKQISVRSNHFIASNESTEYTMKKVQTVLQKKEAIVEIVKIHKLGIRNVIIDSTGNSVRQYPKYNLTDTVFYAALIVYQQSKKPEVVLFKNGNDLEQMFFKNYRNSIQFKTDDTISFGYLWKPIYEVLKRNKIKKVFVSPDGIYNSINISTLKIPTSNKYVSDEMDIQVVTNVKDVIAYRANKKKKKIKSALLFGYPEYGSEIPDTLNRDRSMTLLPSDSSSRFFDGKGIAMLPGTKREIQQIHTLLIANQVSSNEFLERTATEEEIKELISPDVLHIATHGYFLQDIDMLESRSLGGLESTRIVQNPLLRSGLLLAGAQDAIANHKSSIREDGILTAYEAMNLNLDNTDLVVLSACETGLGKVQTGEGVYGLQRAFQTAGAKSVLMSLWKVDDNATQELMTAFYKNWLKSGDKREAFKKAQASVRAKYKHPYYWGAFVLVGE